MSENPYTILNLPASCSFQELRERFYEQSKIFHPDKQAPEQQRLAAEYFARLENSFKKVSTPFRRWLYDNYGEQALELRRQHSDLLDAEEREFNALAAEADSNPSYETKRKLKEKKSSLRKRLEHMYNLNKEKHFFRQKNATITFRVKVDGTRLLEGPPRIYFDSAQMNMAFLFVENSRLGFSALSNAHNVNGSLAYRHDFRFAKHREAQVSAEIVYGNKVGQLNLTAKQKVADYIFSANVSIDHKGKMQANTSIETSWEDSSLTANVLYQSSSIILLIQSSNYYNEKKAKIDHEFLILKNYLSYTCKYQRVFAPQLKGICSLSLGLATNQQEGFMLNGNFHYGFHLDFSRSKSIEALGYIAPNEIGVQFKAERYGLTLDVPLIVSRSFTLTSLCISALLTGVFGYMLHRVSKNPLTDKNRRAMDPENQEMEMKTKRDLFIALIDFVSFAAYERKVYEEANNGLVILNSVFGPVDVIKKYVAGQTDLPVLETTPILQAMVNNSRLFLSFDKLSETAGIYSLNPASKNALFIAYSFQNERHRKVLQKGDKLEIGAFPPQTKWSGLVNLCLKIPV